MEKILEKYNNLVRTPSDINEHLSTLKKYTEECKSVLELGVRNIVSTYAFLAGNPEYMMSCDINMPPSDKLEVLYKEIAETNINYKFVQSDDLKLEIDRNYDLIFIDTWHIYDLLVKELQKFNKYANKYIILHDTMTFRNIGEDPKYKGLYPAISTFLANTPGWSVKEDRPNNNGLMVLERING